MDIQHWKMPTVNIREKWSDPSKKSKISMPDFLHTKVLDSPHLTSCKNDFDKFFTFRPGKTLLVDSVISKKLFNDNDRDGLANALDCQPNNRKKQGFIHDAFQAIADRYEEKELRKEAEKANRKKFMEEQFKKESKSQQRAIYDRYGTLNPNLYPVRSAFVDVGRGFNTLIHESSGDKLKTVGKKENKKQVWVSQNNLKNAGQRIGNLLGGQGNVNFFKTSLKGKI